MDTVAVVQLCVVEVNILTVLPYKKNSFKSAIKFSDSWT